MRERGVHGVPRGVQQVRLVGRAVGLEVFFAAAGEGRVGGGIGGGGGGGVREVGEEAEVLGFVGGVVVGVGEGGGVGWRVGGVFVKVGHV